MLDGSGPASAQGRAVTAKIAAGVARRITSSHKLDTFRPGAVLVADTTTPDREPVTKTAAMVANRGGRTCHAAIVALELGIPTIVRAEHATEALADGALPFHKDVGDLSGPHKPATEIMVKLGDPEVAFRVSLMPCDGVGLARMAFIVNEYIKVHPMAVLHLQRIVDDAVRAQAEAL